MSMSHREPLTGTGVASSSVQAREMSIRRWSLAGHAGFSSSSAWRFDVSI